MDSLFEPGYFDPLESSSSSFLSFSSFADLASSAPSPFVFTSSWDVPSGSKNPTTGLPRSTPNSETDSQLSSPSDPFEIVSAAFEASTPVAEIGIFHTPSKAGPSKLSLADGQMVMGHRPSTSSEWGTPVTPSLSSKSSDSVHAFVTPTDFLLPSGAVQGFSWDDASVSLSTSSYTPPTPTPLRVASNPTLGGAPKSLKALKAVTSMPALKEEEQTSAFQWFDGTELELTPTSSGYVKQLMSRSEDNLIDDTLVGEFDWAFGTYGLGEAVPAESTLFAAFQDTDLSSATTINNCTEQAPLGVSIATTSSSVVPMSWMSTSSQDVDVPILDLTDPLSTYPGGNGYTTVDFAAVMAPSSLNGDDRPSSAPGFNGVEGLGLMSAPMAETMSRSLTSDGFIPMRSAPPRDLFSYAPQQIPANPPAPAPLYTTAPQVYPSGPAHVPRVAPSPVTPMPSSLSQRRPSRNLTIQINSPTFPTYTPAAVAPALVQPVTPQPVIFSQTAGSSSAAIPMARAGTQPLPMTRKLSGLSNAALPNTTPPMGSSHHIHGQPIGQVVTGMPQVQGLRRQAAVRRVSSADAPVMQSMAGYAVQQPAIMGWTGQAVAVSPNGAHSALTSAPLMTVHPPPMIYGAGAYGTSPHRVHPPPYPGTMRPIARMPSSPARFGQRKASNASPSKRSPSGKRRPAPSGGGFSWGEATFINFTSDDAEKLLTGVAPSGSQSKRKREEDAAAAKAAAIAGPASAAIVSSSSSNGSSSDAEGDAGSPRKRSRSSEE